MNNSDNVIRNIINMNYLVLWTKPTSFTCHIRFFYSSFFGFPVG
uniref:Uncharacterized protein n=1 Tax=Anguilla anguilla TaxID=7936 RepID=A0A0E9UUQ8_ANGAN